MSEKITVHFFCMGLVASLLSALLLGVVMVQMYQQRVKTDLQTELSLILAAYGEEDISALAAFDSADLRITLLEPDGTVLYDNAEEGETLRADLRELRLALTDGSGFAVRDGNFCYAASLEDGTLLRISTTAAELPQMLGRYLVMLVVFLLVLAILAAVYAIILTRRLLRPIIELPAQMDDAALADDPARVYPELVPFVKEMQSQRQERENMRQEFTANVTHELKTPLTSISGYAEMISTGIAKPDDIPRFAEKIRIESERMQSLVNDIIELSQLDRGEPLSDPVEVDLLDIANECADQLSASAEQQGVALEVLGTSFVVRGEENKLWEMLYNLVDNSIRYNRRGGHVEILVSPEQRTVTVRDSGIGIPEEHQDRVFERFYRVDKSHSRATGGTGLGLSIVKHIAEQHRARITLHSTPNVGTEIRVTFPE